MRAIISLFAFVAGFQAIAFDSQVGRFELKCESGQARDSDNHLRISRSIECSTLNGKLNICQMVTVSNGPQKKGVRMTLLEPKEKRQNSRVFTAGSTVVVLNTHEMTATIVQNAGMYQFCR